MIRVFVYGTLKRGQPNHFHIENVNNGKATFVGEGLTEKKYPLVIASRCNLPFLLPVEGTGKQIKGEIYDVDDVMIRWLDAFEDSPNWYCRRSVSVLFNGTSHECYSYFLNNHRKELLELPFLESYFSGGAGHERHYLPQLDEDYDSYHEVQEMPVT